MTKKRKRWVLGVADNKFHAKALLEIFYRDLPPIYRRCPKIKITLEELP